MENNNDMILEDDSLGFDDSDFDLSEDGESNQTDAEDTQIEDQDVEAEEGQDEETASGGSEEQQQEQQQQQEQTNPDADLPEKITIKHLKGEMDIQRSDIRGMLQKGVDYDRVQKQRDAAVKQLEDQTKWRQEREDLFTALESAAKQAGTDLAGIVKKLRVNLYRGNGATEAEALARVAQEDAEAKLTAMQQRSTEAQRQQAEQQSRVQREYMEFHSRFPDVRIENVPQSVIQKSSSGEMSLANAYQTYLYDQLKAENQRLQQSLDARKQNESNRQKSLGSAKTAGKGEKADPFLDELFRD